MSISEKDFNLSPEADLDELIQDTNLLIESVYNMFEQPQHSPRRTQTTLGRRIHNNSDSQFGSSSTTSNNNTPPKSPKTPRLNVSNTAVQSTPSSREIEREINRIDRFCEMLEHNLRSASPEQNQVVQDQLGLASSTSPGGRTVNGSPNNAAANTADTPIVEEVIDLCDSMYMPAPPTRRALNVSDDVIIVTPSDDEIVDLCTPNHQRYNARSRISNYKRRSINFNGSTNNSRSTNTPRQRLIPARRSLSSLSSNSSVHCSNECRSLRSSISTTTSTTNMNPSVTAATKRSSNNKTPGANCGNTNAGSDGASDGGRVPFMCAVCMESCVSNQPTSTKCGHVFCANCIRQAVRLTRKCPMCNTKLTVNMLFRIYV